MKRGHIRVGRGFGKQVQEDALKAVGVTNIYLDNPDAAVKSTRKGEILHVVGLRGLASSSAGILSFLDRLHAKGAAAVDISTGWRSDGPKAAALMDTARDELGAERIGGSRAAKMYGRKGGEKAAKNKEGLRTPERTAEKHWHDKSLGTNADAIAKINSYGYEWKWGQRALYNRFGPRGVKPGPVNGNVLKGSL